MDHLCYLCFVFVMLSCLFIAILWSPAGKGLDYIKMILLLMFETLDYLTILSVRAILFTNI